MQQVSDDLRLGNHIEQGLSGDISIIGFPYDIGAQRESIQIGQENGPDCLRRFFPKVGPLINSEYQISISKLKISDYGNISLVDKQNQIYEELLEKLQQKVTNVLLKQNIPFIIGGTKDLSISPIQSLLQIKNNPLVFSISPDYYVNRLYDNDKVTMTSGTRKIFQANDQLIQTKNFKIIFFGIQKQIINMEQKQFIQEKQNIQTIFLDDIRKQQILLNTDINQPITQAGIMFQNNIDQLESYDIHLSVSLEALNSSICPGVSRPSVVGGLIAEEIVEIMFLAGQKKQIKSIDITDYNPNREDYRTGLLLCNLIYFFAMGVAKRLQIDKIE